MASRWIRRPMGKRVLDVSVAAPMLLLTAPVVALIAIVVRVRMGSPAIFWQERAGRSGNPIMVPKFRTMTNDRDPNGNLLPDADRLTPLGRALRATSLDELPQLWTVLKGEMSLIGPRPLPMSYVERYSHTQRRRLDAKPGITGWAQVNGRNSTGWPERLEMDVWYVDNATPLLDIRILVLTLKTALKRDGVSAPGHVTMPEFRGES